jgi:hypothetical protein
MEFYKWQELIGAIIGILGSFILWWSAQKYTDYAKRRENLYYIEKSLIDQIISLIENHKTIKSFIDEKLNKLINEPRNESGQQYSVDVAFFPLFSIRSLGADFTKISTGSGYIDNSLIRVYGLSNDLPHIIEDCRRQFDKVLSFNQEISFNKLNDPLPQRQNYISNLINYRNTLTKEILENNIPIFLKNLTESLILIQELRTIGVWRWKWRFDNKYKFYWKNETYLKDKLTTFDNIDKYFEVRIKEKLATFEL